MGADREIVEEWKEGDCGFKLSLSVDGLACYLSVMPKRSTEVFPVLIEEILRKNGVVFGVRSDVIKRICGRVLSGQRVEDEVVAEGCSPADPEPEWVDFKVSVTSDVPRYDHVGGDGLDFHHAHLFENVAAGQWIGTHKPGKPGKPGCTVRGNPIPVPPDAVSAEVKTGVGVELDAKGFYYSLIPGRIVFENHTISVSDELLIDGDVGYETGDIDFVGFVHITGSVLAGYTVRSGRGLLVDQVIEGTTISSGGDIRICGMAGGEKQGFIHCGGKLHARYLRDVQVECAGDITVAGEAMNCTLHSGGSITAALIAGGNAIALAGIEANRLGSSAGERTCLRAGVDYRSVEELDAVEQELVSLQKQRKELLVKLDHAGESAFASLAKELEALELKIEAFDAKSHNIRCAAGPGVNAKVNVGWSLFDGVEIHLGRTVKVQREHRPGACSIIESDEGELVFLPCSALQKNAKELQDELWLMEQ